MEATLAFYGQGLARILEVIRRIRTGISEVHQHLVDDKVVRGLLLIHDLHPVDLQTVGAMRWIMSVRTSRATEAT